MFPSITTAFSLLRRTTPRLPCKPPPFPLFFSSSSSSSSSYPPPPRKRTPLAPSTNNTITPPPFRTQHLNLQTLHNNNNRPFPYVLPDFPDDFPFDIIDNPEDKSITLNRKLEGQSVQVTVSMQLELDVEVEYKEGFVVGVGCVVDEQVGSKKKKEDYDGLEIKDVWLKRSGDVVKVFFNKEIDESRVLRFSFDDLDKHSKKDLRIYLDAKGINRSLFDFLNNYMKRKHAATRDNRIWVPYRRRKKVLWLKDMKEIWLPCNKEKKVLWLKNMKEYLGNV